MALGVLNFNLPLNIKRCIRTLPATDPGYETVQKEALSIKGAAMVSVGPSPHRDQGSHIRTFLRENQCFVISGCMPFCRMWVAPCLPFSFFPTCSSQSGHQKWERNKETSSAFREKTTQTFFRVSNTGTPKKAPPTFLYLWAKNGRILPIWATWHPLTFQPVLPPKSWKLVTIRLAFSAQPLHCSKNFTHEWQVGTICNNLQAKIPPSLRNCTQ